VEIQEECPDAIVKSWKPLPLGSEEPSAAASLPTGVLKQLAGETREYCDDQFAEGFRKDSQRNFAGRLLWSYLSITPLRIPQLWKIRDAPNSLSGDSG
jgi:hypothetical protein